MESDKEIICGEFCVRPHLNQRGFPPAATASYFQHSSEIRALLKWLITERKQGSNCESHNDLSSFVVDQGSTNYICFHWSGLIQKFVIKNIIESDEPQSVHHDYQDLWCTIARNCDQKNTKAAVNKS